MTAFTQKKSIIIFAVPIILFLFWINGLYLPINSRIQTANGNLSELQQELIQNQAAIGDIISVKSSVKSIEKRLADYLDEIYSIDSISKFIQTIDDDLKEFGIIDRTVTPHLPDLLQSKNIHLGEQRLNQVEFTIKGQGRYLQIGKFIEKLNKKSFYAGAGNLEIVYNANINPRVLFDLKFSAYLKDRGKEND